MDDDARRARERECFTQALGGWLEAQRWEVWGTLTFAVEMSQGAARRAAARFLRRVAVEEKKPVRYYWASEHGEAGGRLHLHVLLAGVGDLRYNRLRELWGESTMHQLETGRPARSHFQRYRAFGGGSGYAAKYVAKGLADWDVSAPEGLAVTRSRRESARARRKARMRPGTLAAAYTHETGSEHVGNTLKTDQRSEQPELMTRESCLSWAQEMTR